MTDTTRTSTATGGPSPAPAAEYALYGADSTNSGLPELVLYRDDTDPGVSLPLTSEVTDQITTTSTAGLAGSADQSSDRWWKRAIDAVPATTGAVQADRLLGRVTPRAQLIIAGVIFGLIVLGTIWSVLVH